MRQISAGARRILHLLFGASLALKGGFSLLEIGCAAVLLLVPNARLLGAADWLTLHALAVHGPGAIARHLQPMLAAFSVQTQTFYALYILAHGILKLGMVLALWRELRFAWPAALAILAGFIAYQLHHFAQGGGPALLILSGFDTLMFALVAWEWRQHLRPLRPALLRPAA